MCIGEKLRSGLGAIALVLAIGLVVSGCGRKGALEPPPGASVSQTEPAPGQSEQPEKPDQPFILDSLI